MPHALPNTVDSYPRSLPLVTIGLLGTSAALMWTTALGEHFQFDRNAAAAGELWRILTGHLTHWGVNHFCWDAIVFAVLGTLCERRHRVRTVLCLTLSALLIPFAVCAWIPDMMTYRGLSGLDTALFTLLAGLTLREKLAAREWRWVAVIGGLLVGLLLKTGFELITGGTLFVDSTAANFVPVPLAHIIGAIVGVMAALPISVDRRKTTRTLPVRPQFCVVRNE